MKQIKTVASLLLALLVNQLAYAEIQCTDIGKSFLAAQPGSNAFLRPGQCMWSPSRNVALVMQTDGNLVLYDPSNMGVHWATMTFATPATLAMQEDGNLVVYHGSIEKPAGHSWNSKTSGEFAPYFLSVQDDGNLVIYRGKDPNNVFKAIWSRTGGNLNKTASSCHPLDPICDLIVKANKGCLSATVLKTGASISCVSCVVGAVYTGGTVGAACASACGSAAAAEELSKEQGC